MREQILRALATSNPEALLLEPRGLYDAALVGITQVPEDHWPREPGVWVAVYSREKCIDLIAKDAGCDVMDAIEHFEFNVSGGWNGSGTPTFVSAGLEDVDTVC